MTPGEMPASLVRAGYATRSPMHHAWETIMRLAVRKVLVSIAAFVDDLTVEWHRDALQQAVSTFCDAPLGSKRSNRALDALAYHTACIKDLKDAQRARTERREA